MLNIKMNKKEDLIKKLITSILKKDINTIIDIINDLMKYKLTNTEIIYILEKTTIKVKSDYYYTLSGSGGSGISKPNITSIASLYLSAMGIPIIKIGSHKKTSLNGSTDFFKYYKLDKCRTKFFNYYDVDEIFPWMGLSNLLSIHQDFYNFFCNNVYHGFKAKNKITLVSDPLKYDSYIKKNHYLKSDNHYICYSKVNKYFSIDEFTSGRIYVNGQIFLKTSTIKKIPEISFNNLVNINKDLLEGNLNHGFWYESLKYTIGCSLYLFKFKNTLNEAYETFEKYYRQGLMKYIDKLKG